ncbi:MAG: type II secretion system protein [Planctomycetota bacterium]|jgi:prepilin-type N-terminal cleavage/methylation domain-containing protein
MPAYIKKKRGFTLIELLVVIAIIALLLSIITPALHLVKERARRILCSNGLRQWGIALAGHSAANNKIPTIVRRYDGGLFPSWMGAVPPRMQEDPPIPWPDNYSTSEWSVYTMNPYIDCVDKNYENNGLGSDILACPNASGEFFVELLYIFWQDMCQGDSNTYWIFPSYSYWGGLADVIAISETPYPREYYSTNALRELTLDTMSPRRLLMSENLYLDSGIWWNYNHGRKGWSCAFGWLAPQYQIKEKLDGEQDATGTSQLFGDGRVEWRPIPLKFEDNLPSERSDLGDVVGFNEDQWNGPGSGFIESLYGVDYAYY